MTIPPRDPIAAVTHTDPYPYYASLVRERPLYRDEGLKLWIASGAEAVMAVLTSPDCRVRPPDEPVPKALLGSAAGEIFRHLVRMNDGERHCPLKQAVSTTLASLDQNDAEAESHRWADRLAGNLGSVLRRGQVARFLFDLSAHVIGTLLGLPEKELPQIALRTGDFVRCLVPTSAPEEIQRGKVAAGQLLDMFRSHLTDSDAGSSGLLGALTAEAKRVGRGDADAIAANGIGFLSQAYEATAGLIGNTLLRLARDPELLDIVENDRDAMRNMISEVLRHDPPIQNTRRFVVATGTVVGQVMSAGDAILVVIAAANRDPSINPDPTRFDLWRRDRRSFTFGTGGHACPGEMLATTIASAGVGRLLRSGLKPELLAGSVSYRASANARIPLFSAI
jgi:cytochrome P450